MSRSAFVLSLSLAACGPARPQQLDTSFDIESGRFACADGTLCSPHAVDRTPFRAQGSFAEAPSAVVRANSCDWERDLTGAEAFYEVRVWLPGLLEATLETDEDAGVYVFDRQDGDACVGGGDGFFDLVGPGRYLVLVDSTEGATGDYALGVDTLATQVVDDPYEPNDDQDSAFDNARHAFDPIDGTLAVRGTLTADSPIDIHHVYIAPDADAAFDAVDLPEGIRLSVSNDEDGELLAEDERAVDSLVHDPTEEGYGIWVTLELEDPEQVFVDYTFRLTSPR